MLAFIFSASAQSILSLTTGPRVHAASALKASEIKGEDGRADGRENESSIRKIGDIRRRNAH